MPGKSDPSRRYQQTKERTENFFDRLRRKTLPRLKPPKSYSTWSQEKKDIRYHDLCGRIQAERGLIEECKEQINRALEDLKIRKGDRLKGKLRLLEGYREVLEKCSKSLVKMSDELGLNGGNSNKVGEDKTKNLEAAETFYPDLASTIKGLKYGGPLKRVINQLYSVIT